ncbi:MAG: hypothetical protein Q9163_002256 [Psora crenata]
MHPYMRISGYHEAFDSHPPPIAIVDLVVVDTLYSLLIPTSILLHLYFAPFTKVEESFNIQATHDILANGFPWRTADTELRKHYDHLTFTAVLAARDLLPIAGRSPSSRSSHRRHETALVLLTTAGIVFRSEIVILLACRTAYLYLHHHIRLSLFSIVRSGLLGALIGLGLTVPLDTFLWRSPAPLWPELTAFVYNFVHSKSSSWGVSPWHFYFTSALPRILFNPVLPILILFTLSIPILRRPALDISIPNLLFVVIYSFHPHKEWRFIVYVVPPMLAVASAGASWVWTRRFKTFVYRILALALLASTLASFAASGAMLAVSRLNYPGAEALNRLHELAGNETGVVKVHMDTLSCMTGVTRFLERPAPALEGAERAFWVYDKTEDERKLLDPSFWDGFDYVLAERPDRVVGQWEVLDTIEAFAGIGMVRPDEGLEMVHQRSVNNQEFAEMAKGLLLQERRWGERDGERLRRYIAVLWSRMEIAFRTRVSQGWWVKIKMEPRVRILKRQKVRSNVAASEGGISS